MTNVTDLLDLDINDGEDTFPDLDASNKGSNNDLLQTPSPISETDVLPATHQSPTAFSQKSYKRRRSQRKSGILPHQRQESGSTYLSVYETTDKKSTP